MALKFMLENLEGLDENIAGLYVKHSDDKFYLDVTGAVSKAKLDEFRNNNIELTQKLETFEGIDPKEFKGLVKFKKDNVNIDADTEEKIKLQVSERVKTMQTDFDTKIKTSNDTIVVQGRQLEGLLIDSAVRKVVSGKALPEAVDDVLLRAKSVFKVDKGVATPFDGEGNMIYGKDGANPMTIDDWVGGLSKNAPHLFVQSSGGGSQGGGNNNHSAVDVKNMSPLQKINAGLTERGS